MEPLYHFLIDTYLILISFSSFALLRPHRAIQKRHITHLSLPTVQNTLRFRLLKTRYGFFLYSNTVASLVVGNNILLTLQIVDEKSLIKKYQNEIRSLKEELEQLKSGTEIVPQLKNSNKADLVLLKQKVPSSLKFLLFLALLFEIYIDFLLFIWILFRSEERSVVKECISRL